MIRIILTVAIVAIAGCKTSPEEPSQRVVESSGSPSASSPRSSLAKAPAPEEHPFEVLAREAKFAATEYLEETEGRKPADKAAEALRTTARELAAQDSETIAAVLASPIPEQAESAVTQELPPGEEAGTAARQASDGQGVAAKSSSSSGPDLAVFLPGIAVAGVGVWAGLCGIANYKFSTKSRLIGTAAIATVALAAGGILLWQSLGLAESPEARFIKRMNRVAETRKRLLPRLQSGDLEPIAGLRLGLCPGLGLKTWSNATPNNRRLHYLSEPGSHRVAIKEIKTGKVTVYDPGKAVFPKMDNPTIRPLNQQGIVTIGPKGKDATHFFDYDSKAWMPLSHFL